MFSVFEKQENYRNPLPVDVLFVDVGSVNNVVCDGFIRHIVCAANANRLVPGHFTSKTPGMQQALCQFTVHEDGFCIFSCNFLLSFTAAAATHLMRKASDSLGTSLLRKNLSPSKSFFWASCCFSSFSLASIVSMSSWRKAIKENTVKAVLWSIWIQDHMKAALYKWSHANDCLYGPNSHTISRWALQAQNNNSFQTQLKQNNKKTL